MDEAQDENAPGGGGRTPFTRPAFVVSAAFLLSLLVGLVWVLAPSGESPTGSGAGPAPATGAPQEAPSVPGGAGGGGDSVCGMEPGPQEVPSKPLGLEVVRVSPSLTVPSVSGVGPGVTDGVTRCFAKSPTGAVVAATSFLKWLSSNEQLDVVTQTLFAPGSDRDRMVAEVRASWDGSTAPPVTVLGYKVKARGDDEVVVTLAVAEPSDLTRIVSWPLVMVWQEGDWKVKPSPTGDWDLGKVDSLQSEGYVLWAV